MNQFDQWKRKVKYGNPWLILVVVILMLSFIFMIISNLRNKQLDVYNNSDKVSQYEFTEDKNPTKESFLYENEEYGYSIKIPNDWKRVEENGFISFIHQPSSSSIKMIESDYDPNLNNIDKTAISNTISSEGYSFVDFKYLTTSSYELIYQDQQTNIYDYMDEVFWNTDKQVKIQCCFNDVNYEKILPYYQSILESFQWTDKEKIIDDNISITYIEDLGVQFGIPSSWSKGVTDNIITAYDEESATNFFFSCESMNHKQLTGVDVSNYLNDNLEGFVMNSYEGKEDHAHAVCTYLQNNIQWIRNAYVFTNENLVYFMVYDYQKGMLNEEIPEKCQKYFKIFEKKEEDVNTESSDNDNQNTNVHTETESTQIPDDTQQPEDVTENMQETTESITENTQSEQNQKQTDSNHEIIKNPEEK